MREPLVVPPKTAGRMLKMRSADVYAVIREGKLAAIRRNGRYLVPVVELERYVAEELERGSS
jgi:hypothetical protein